MNLLETVDNTNIVVTAVVSLFTALLGSGIVTTLVLAVLERKKRRAEAIETEEKAQLLRAQWAEQIRQTASAMIEELNEKVTRLERQYHSQARLIHQLRLVVNAYADRLAYLMVGIESLHRQILSLKQIPVWTPDLWQAPTCEESPDNAAIES
jgi:hypothetical protein